MRLSDWSSDACSSDLLERETVDAPLHDIIDFSEIPNAVLQGTDGYRLEEEENGTTIVVVKRQGQVADKANVDTQENALARRDFRDLAREHAGLDVAALQLSIGIGVGFTNDRVVRSEEHTSELQSLMRNTYAVFC